MNYLTLAQAKKHLNLDSGYTEDDGYITTLCEIAENAVEVDGNLDLSGITAQNEGELPQPLIGAMLLMVGNLYQNREIVGSKVQELPYNYKYLIDLYRDYSEE